MKSAATILTSLVSIAALAQEAVPCGSGSVAAFEPLRFARKAEGGKGDQSAWIRWCTVAGTLLVIWTVVELILIPNGLSMFYFVLGILQLVTALYLRRAQHKM